MDILLLSENMMILLFGVIIILLISFGILLEWLANK